MARNAVRVLYAGDGETLNYLVTKGMNFYMAGGYQDESMYLRGALAEDGAIEVTHVKPGESLEVLPRTPEEYAAYDVVVLSDIGADSVLFYMNRDVAPMGPNRLKSIREFVRRGGGFMMIGGWSSFGGWGGQARYGGTPVEEILPVFVKDGDDRVETPEGCGLEVRDPAHPVTAGLDWSFGFVFNGYNRIEAKPGASVLAVIGGGDPLLAVGGYGAGRSMAFATDCAPHWAGTLVQWPDYARFWCGAVRWLGRK